MDMKDYLIITSIIKMLKCYKKNKWPMDDPVVTAAIETINDTRRKLFSHIYANYNSLEFTKYDVHVSGDSELALFPQCPNVLFNNPKNFYKNKKLKVNKVDFELFANGLLDEIDFSVSIGEYGIIKRIARDTLVLCHCYEEVNDCFIEFPKWGRCPPP